jgi:hypothetical protein
LFSFRGQRARITKSVLGPGNADEIRIRATLLAREDYGDDIVFAVTNYGRILYLVSHGNCIGQIILVGVGDVECEILDADNSRVCLDNPVCVLAASSAETTGETPSSYQRDPKSYKKPWVGHQRVGGPKQRACVILMLLHQNPAGCCSHCF